MSAIFKKYAAYYDLLYAQKDYAGEVEYLDTLIKKKCEPVSGKTEGDAISILDLGCGSGRHAYYFSQKGFKVMGVDLSVDMIKIAKDTCLSQDACIPDDILKNIYRNTSARNNLALRVDQFIVGDVRSVRLAGKFDLICSLFHVVSYQTSLADLAALFETAFFHLSKNGFFFFDFWYGPGVLSDRPVIRIKRMEDQAIKVVRLAEPVLDLDKHIVEIDYDIFIQQQSTKQWDNFQEKHTMHYWFIDEVKEQLLMKGFRDIEFYHWLSFEKPGPHSWYALGCCRKK